MQGILFFFPSGNLSTYPHFLETVKKLEKNVGMWVSCPLAVFAKAKTASFNEVERNGKKSFLYQK